MPSGAAQFGVGISTAILWVQRFRRTGSVEPDKIGGYKPCRIAGAHEDWLLRRAVKRTSRCAAWSPSLASAA